MDDVLKPVLVMGDTTLASEVANCLQIAGHAVTQVVKADAFVTNFELVIVIGKELLMEKQAQISMLEKYIAKTAIIAINTESIPLDSLQRNARNQERIIGLNWTSPVHTTFFLELISNEKTNSLYADTLLKLARTQWNKDPHHLHSGLGIRGKMMAAMFREAAYLVQNGYASVKDIDRACRNDAGYYLPFAGNFRYMDLMGTYAYGMVMKDLNPELSNSKELPEFFSQIILQGGKGIENNNGFYNYTDEEKENLTAQFAIFNRHIHELIARYSNLNQPL